MLIIKDDSVNFINFPTAVALGNFDGLHVGHRYLINIMTKIAEAGELVPTVCTFDPHPARLYGNKTQLIFTSDQKIQYIESLCVEVYFEVFFNQAVASCSPKEFFNEYIVRRMNAKAVVVGFDFFFGKSRSGNVELLEEFCREAGISCTIVPAVTTHGVPVSSTSIRKFLKEGDLKNVTLLLGRYISFMGVVTSGEKIGRTLGYPTVNLAIKNEIIPIDGIYAGYTFINNDCYPAMVYLGDRPTMIANGEHRFEVNIIGYNGADLYGKTIEVFLIEFLREGVKFETIAELKAQMKKDESDTVKVFEKRKFKVRDL